MQTEQILFRIKLELENNIACITCPFCKQSVNVAFSSSRRTDGSWWNISNFSDHVKRKHKDFSSLDSEAKLEIRK